MEIRALGPEVSIGVNDLSVIVEKKWLPGSSMVSHPNSLREWRFEWFLKTNRNPLVGQPGQQVLKA